MRNRTKLVIAGVGVVALLGGGGSAVAAASAASSQASVAQSSGGTLIAAKAEAAAASITRKQAIAIAKKKVPGAWVTEVEREWEHGHRTSCGDGIGSERPLSEKPARPDLRRS